MKRFFTILLIAVALKASAASSVKVSALPDLTNDIVNADLIIIDAKVPGHTTNDTFKTTIGNLFSGVHSNYWQFDGVTLSPSFSPSFVGATNLVSYGLFNFRAVMFSGTGSSTLSVGANDVAVTDKNRITLVGTTATASDTTLNLDNGNGAGQLLILQNASTNLATFTMPMIQAQSGDPTKTNRLRSDWTPTLLGESIWLYNNGKGWVEIARPGTTNFTTVENIFVTNGYSIYINGTNALESYDSTQFTNSQTVANGLTNLTLHIRNQPHITNAVLNEVITLDGLAYTFPSQYQANSLLADASGTGTLTWGGTLTNPLSNVYFTNTIYLNGTNLAIINPTDGYVPYRASATTFENSPIERSAATSLTVHNTGGGQTLWLFANSLALAADNQLIIQPNSTGESDPNFGTTGFLAVTAAPATALAQQYSPGISWKGRGWQSNAGESRDVLFSSFVAPATGAANPTGILYIESNIYTNAATTNFSLSSSSGWTGVGTKALTDDGTYKTFGGSSGTVGTVIATGTPAVGDVLSAADVSGTNTVWSSRLWYSYTNTDMEGGVIFTVASTNSIQTNVVSFAQNYLTNFWGVPGLVFVVSSGNEPAYAAGLAVNNTQVYGIGSSALYDVTMTNTGDIYAFGDNALAGLNATNVFDAYGFGGTPLYFADLIDSFTILAYGSSALYNAHLTNSHRVFAYGYQAGKDLAGTYDDIYLFGNNPQPTLASDQMVLRSGDFLFNGGGKVRSIAGFASLATDAAVAISATGWTNSFGKAATAWLNGTAATYVVYNNAGTAITTNSLAAGTTVAIPLQSGGKFIVTSGTGISGNANPW